MFTYLRLERKAELTESLSKSGLGAIRLYLLIMHTGPGPDSRMLADSGLCHNGAFFFHCAVRPQKPSGLLGTGQVRGRIG